MPDRPLKRFLASVTHDLAGSLLVQLTTLAATLLVAAFSSLAETAKYTLALSIAAPLYLMSSMATSELIVARAPGFQDYSVICIAKAIVLSFAFGICVLFLLLGPLRVADASFMTVFGLVYLARLFDCFFDTSIQFFRREFAFSDVLRSSMIYALSFAALATVVLASSWTPVHYGMPLAACGASLLAANCSMVSLRRTTSIWSAGSSVSALHFARTNYTRGIAFFANSLQTAFPRYLLEWFALPQQQAAYTILGMICRAFILPLQSLFVPMIPSFAKRYAKNATMTLKLAFTTFACLAAAISAAFALAWSLASKWELTRLINDELPTYLSVTDGILVVCASGLYLLRYSIWQIIAMYVPGERQLAYSVAALVATIAAGVLIIPSFSIAGAAAADVVGSFMLLALPLFYLFRHTHSVRPVATPQSFPDSSRPS